MGFKRGDHICALYSTTPELAQAGATFLADGLRDRQRCWYVASGDEADAIGAAMRELDIDVTAEIERGALKFISGDHAYIVHGAFNPEATLDVFNNAIQQALRDGFTGFRAAAEMSWALECEDGAYSLIVYEALLRALFANCDAIGLCLYHRSRMPLDVINGALATHPIAGCQGHYQTNHFYDSNVDRLFPVGDGDVLTKLEQLSKQTSSGGTGTAQPR